MFQAYGTRYTSYGYFIPEANVLTRIPFNSEGISKNVSFGPDRDLIVEIGGVYLVQYFAYLLIQPTVSFQFWLLRNDATVAETNSMISANTDPESTLVNGHIITELNAGDTIALAVQFTASGVIITMAGGGIARLSLILLEKTES